MEERRSKIRGMLLGGAVGDALGYPIEFEPIMEPNTITSYRDGKGLISDDTQMTLFTANGLLWTYTRGALRGISLLPPDALYLAYRDWLSTQERVEIDEAHQICWIHDLPELNQLRAPGNTCLSALRSGKKGTIEDPINDNVIIGLSRRRTVIYGCWCADAIDYQFQWCPHRHRIVIDVLNQIIIISGRETGERIVFINR
jgi:hypothetical protein